MAGEEKAPGSDLLRSEFSWPKPDDVAFTGDARQGAQIDPYGHGRLVLMMTGYKEAADHLVDVCMRKEYQRDILVYNLQWQTPSYSGLLINKAVADVTNFAKRV